MGKKKTAIRKAWYVAGENRSMSTREIGERLGMTRANAEKICRIALLKLRAEFERRGLSHVLTESGPTVYSLPTKAQLRKAEVE